MSRNPDSADARIVIVFNEAWFVRRLLSVTHDLVKNHKVYRCDEHLAGPFTTEEVIEYLKERVRG